MSWSPVVRSGASSGGSSTSTYEQHASDSESDGPASEAGPVTFSIPSLGSATPDTENASSQVSFTMAIDTLAAPEPAPTDAPGAVAPPLNPATLSMAVPPMGAPAGGVSAPSPTLSTQVFASSELVSVLAPEPPVLSVSRPVPPVPTTPTTSVILAPVSDAPVSDVPVSDVAVSDAPVSDQSMSSASLIDSGRLPTIVEATPSEHVQSEVALLHAHASAEAVGPVPDAASIPTGATPEIPSIPAAVVPVVPAVHRQPDQSALTLPRQHAAPRVPPATPMVDAGRRRPKKRDRSGAIARVGFFLLLIAALVSGGVIFGRPYLFPAEWQPDALVYAEPIEAARGTDFAEPVMLIAQPAATQDDMVAARLLGDVRLELPTWRALGLASADAADDSGLRILIADQAPVLYSTVDGQVYVDESFTGPYRDELITRAMTEAAIDQDVGFSTPANRSLDAEAIVQAHVRQQVAAVQLVADPTSTAVPTPEMAPLVFLPPVLDYRITAPMVFAQLLAPFDPSAPDPLGDLATTLPGPLREQVLGSMASVSTVASDAATGLASPMDRSFWYLVFAGHLDPAAAYDLSNVIVSAGLQTVQATNGTCAVATFATAVASDADRLFSGLETWAASAAPEMGATATRNPDGSVQLRSCDPVSGYTSSARIGVARSLIAWRAVEMAVVNAVAAQRGDASMLGAALAAIATDPSVLALVELPAGTTPDDVASAARTAASDVIARVTAGVAAGG